MRKLSVCLFLYLFFNQSVNGEVNSQCNTKLEPRDKASEFIATIQCLNREIIKLQSELNRVSILVRESNAAVAAANSAAERAARSAEGTQRKLDRMFKKSMME